MYRYEQFTGRRLLLAVVDATLGSSLAMLWGWDAGSEWHVGTSVVLAAATVLPMALSGAYIHALRRSLDWHRFAALIAAASATACAVAMRTTRRPSACVLGFWLLFGVLYGVRVVLIRTHAFFLGRKRLWVIAESEATARRIAGKVMSEGKWYEVVDCSERPGREGLRAHAEGCDAVLCTPELRTSVETWCGEAGKELMIVPGSSEVLLFNAGAQKFDDLLVLSLATFRLTPMQQFLKRLVDVVGSAILLVLFAPIMLVVPFVIRIESEGPALFRQERRGLRGKSFDVLKFRTMRVDAEELSGPVLACRQDPRITRVGQVLRHTRLDELPQLWNVLMGEMSLVGPRPEREFFARRFDVELPDYRLRSAVKPGLTGLAQVWGSYSTTAEAKLRLDLMYIANYSLLQDLSLLLHTIRVVFGRKQAAGLDPAAGLRFGFQAGEERREA